MAEEQLELLFFDTFTHENTEELNLDLVQFPRPVVIFEVRIIPLQTRVQADVPGGVRLGASNPSNFKLELFVNNLSKPNAATFERLGTLNYRENVDIQMKTDGEVPTDGLILKGWYNTITIAIYGILTTVKPDHTSPPPPPPQPRPKSQSVDSRHSDSSHPEWEQPRQQQHPLDYIQQQVQQAEQQLQKAQLQQQPVHIPHPQPTHGPPTAVPPPTPQPVPPPRAPPLPVPPPLQSVPTPHQPVQPPHQPVQPPLQPILPQLQPVPPPLQPVPPPHQPVLPPHKPQEMYPPREKPFPQPQQHIETPRDYNQSPKSVPLEAHFESHFSPSLHQEPHREPKHEFPPEPKEPYESCDAYDEKGGQESPYDWDFQRSSRSRRDSRDSDDRDSRGYRSSRESSREPRDRDHERDYREGNRDSREFRDRDKDRESDRNREKERYRDSEKERDRDWEREREQDRYRDRKRDYESHDRPASPPRRRSRSRSGSPSRRSKASAPESPSPMEPPVLEEEPLKTEHVPDEMPELFDVMSPAQSPTPDMLNFMSDGEIQDDDVAYEDISSEDEMVNMGDMMPEISEDFWSYATSGFNPFQCYLSQLSTFPDISQTQFEKECAQWLQTTDARTRPVEAQSLLDAIEEFSETEHDDRWIEALEGLLVLLPKGLSYLLFKEKKKDVLETLIHWTFEGLDLDKAVAQPRSAYKVRHLKLGIKLAGNMCCCDNDIAVKILGKGIQSKLLDLYRAPFMSFSMKLQIIRALDLSTWYKDGFDWFLGRHTLQLELETMSTSEPEENTMLSNCYQRLLNIMLQKQTVRAVVALSALTKKIHAYEMMTTMATVVENMMETLPSPDEECDHDKAKDDPDVMEPEVETMATSLNATDVKTIGMCLKELTLILVNAPSLITQPKRSFPGQLVVDTKSPPFDPYPNLYNLLHNCHVMECVFFLLSNPATSSNIQLFVAVRDLLLCLLETQHGLLFLSSRTEVTNGIIRSLVQMADYNRDEQIDDNPGQQLGLELTYFLQTLQYVDQLLDYHRSFVEKSVDDAEPLGILHSLCSMTLSPVGAEAVARVLGLDNNLQALLPFIELNENEKNSEHPVCASYTFELLLVMLHYSDQVDVLEKFGNRILAACEEDAWKKQPEIYDWLAPIKKFTSFNHDGIASVINQLKQYEEVEKLPHGLVTTLRVLQSLAVPKESNLNRDKQEQLKYKVAITEIYGAECLPLLISYLQKLVEARWRSWQKGQPQSNRHLRLYVAIIKPCIQIIKATLSQLILVRGSEYNDLTTLPVLFDLHTVMCSVPGSTLFTAEIQKIQKAVIDTLLAYTQPVLNQAETEEALSQSQWTKTMKEILKYTLKAPQTYLSGLLMLSEMLPLPLPLQTKEPLNKREEVVAITSRKLWSAHLHALTPQLYEVIQTFAMSSCQPLQQLLRRVCWQLSDLAAPTALIVTRCILDIVLEGLTTSITVSCEEKADGETEVLKPKLDVEKATSPHAKQMLNLLAYVLSQPTIKCALLQLVRSDVKGEEKYAELFPLMLQVLNLVSDRPAHSLAQECVVSILQSLCDIEVSLVLVDAAVSLQDLMASCLPCSEDMVQITTALLEHIGHPDHHYASILPCVRTLAMLTENDYGFYHLKWGLERISGVFSSLLMRVNNTFSKESSDCLSTLSTTLELLRLLIAIETTEEVTMTRTYTLLHKQLQDVLQWKADTTEHPLLDLEKLLEDCSKEEDTLESLLESIRSLIKILRDTAESKEDLPDLVEPVVLNPITLSDLFNVRAICSIVDTDDERLNPSYWLSNPATEEPDLEPDLVHCNMDEIVRKYCQDFNLEEELQKGTVPTAEELTRPRRTKDRRKSQEIISIGRGRGFGRQQFVAPMRGGRGIATRGNSMANRSDPFRSRPPNTSRPPSMHVDDFMKMEKTRDSRSPGPQDMGRGGGRGGRGFDRGRGFTGRGYFFTPPGRYGNRDDMGFRGRSGPYIDRFKPNFQSPRTFTRDDMNNRPGSAERRGGSREPRFTPRGGRGYWPRKDDERFHGRGMGFRGDRDESRHVRSFTK